MQNTEQERHSWIKLFVILFILFSLGYLSYIASKLNISINLDNDKAIFISKLEQAFSVIIIFILPTLMFALFWTKTKIHYLGLTKKVSTKTIVLSALFILFAIPLINWIGSLNEQMALPQAFSGMEAWMQKSEVSAKNITDAYMQGTSFGVLITNLIVVALLAALSEELFFRGMLQKVLIECCKNKHVGIWIGAILFSAFHMQFYGFFPRMLMGASLGYLFLWSGSLWPGIITHFVNNGMAVLLVWLSNRGVISPEIDKIGSDDSQTILVLLSSALVATSLVLIYRIEKKRKNSLIA
ncbi:hypothetical protein BH10BAC1_BH10BAC1_07040 [soil metagenome]